MALQQPAVPVVKLARDDDERPPDRARVRNLLRVELDNPIVLVWCVVALQVSLERAAVHPKHTLVLSAAGPASDHVHELARPGASQAQAEDVPVDGGFVNAHQTFLNGLGAVLRTF